MGILINFLKPSLILPPDSVLALHPPPAQLSRPVSHCPPDDDMSPAVSDPAAQQTVDDWRKLFKHKTMQENIKMLAFQWTQCAPSNLALIMFPLEKKKEEDT